MGQKISAFIVAFVLLLTTATCVGATNATKLEVHYRIPTDTIDIVVLNSEASEANIVITDDENAAIDSYFALIKTLTKDTDGAFRYTTVMPDSSVSGKYYVTVKTDLGEELSDSFWYMSETQAAGALGDLSSATPQNFASLISTHHEDLGIDVDLFNSDSAHITEAFFEFKPNGSLDKKSFLTAYAYACLFGTSVEETNLEAIRNSLALEAGHIGFDLSNFDALNDAAQTEVLNKLKEGSYDGEDPQTLLQKWITMADINNTGVTTVDNFKNLLFNKYSNVLQLDLTGYNQSNQQNEIMLDIINGVPYSSIETLQAAFVKAVGDHPYISDSRGGSGGGGGGGFAVQPPSVEKPTVQQNPGSAEFIDVSTEHWAYNPIKALYKKGIITGKAPNQFFPEDYVTRAEFSKIIAQTFFADSAVADIAFIDVTESAWYYEPVMKLANLGIILGNPDGSFCPDAHITRQDAAVIIKRVCDKKGISLSAVRGNVAFGDWSAVGEYATEAVETLYVAGIINGMSDNTFMPTSSLTRAQAVQMVYTVMQKMEEGINV